MAKFLLAFACVAAGLGDFKAEPCLQVADFIYSISWMCFQGCGCLGMCGSGQWCGHAALGSRGSAALSEEPVRQETTRLLSFLLESFTGWFRKQVSQKDMAE